MNKNEYDLMERAKWSDWFFNFDDCLTLNTGDESFQQDAETAARSFLRAYPDCPYSAEWLIADYRKRL